MCAPYPPVSTSQLLGLQVCTFMLGLYDARDWTQVFMHPRQELYQMRYITNLACFWNMVFLWGPGLASHSLCIPGWLVTMILLASQVLLTGVNNHTCGQGDSFECLQEVCDFDRSHLPLNVWRLEFYKLNLCFHVAGPNTAPGIMVSCKVVDMLQVVSF